MTRSSAVSIQNESVGISLPVELGLSLQQHVRLARTAEAVGFGTVVAGEIVGYDALALLASIAASTKSIGLGTAVISVFSRPASLLAAGFATLSAAANGRPVIAGIGAGSAAIVRGWYGVPFEHPLDRVTETMTILRMFFGGEKVDFDGRTLQTHGFRLSVPVDSIPIYIGAMGDGMLEVAGALADGVVLALRTPSNAREQIDKITAGAMAGGRSPDEVTIVASGLRVYCGPRRSEARANFKRVLLTYAMVPTHRSAFTDLGIELEAVEEAWRAGDRKGALRAFSEYAVDELCVVGGPDDVCRRIEQFRAQGVQRLLIQPSGASDQDFTGCLSTIEEVGRAM